MFVTDAENTSWRALIDGLLPLIESGEALPRVTREELARADGGGTTGISVGRSLKHLVSSEVRQAIRKDPLWEKVDGALRRGVARMGKAAEDMLRLSVEGPLKVEKATSGPRFDPRLCRQQLRGVIHSCELAARRIAYKPVVSPAESMEAFRNWYRIDHVPRLRCASAVWHNPCYSRGARPVIPAAWTSLAPGGVVS
jgi:hypothetical protein